MALSRKTKNSRTKASKLKSESPSKREHRLKSQRKRSSQYYSQLSDESRKELITSICNLASRKRKISVDSEENRKKRNIARSQARANETLSSRFKRLTQMRDHVSTVRERESQSERLQRLDQMRLHAKHVRELESPSSSSTRLEQMRDHAQNVRALESPISRSIRLEQMRDHAQDIRELESPTSRSMRLEQMRDHAQNVREIESPNSRSRRLDELRSQSRVRRQLFASDDTTFDSMIFQVADIECYVCRKLLYKKQSRGVSTETITVVPSYVPARINCCKRCANKLLKNQCPSNAFWNNMSVISIPPELYCLSEMELRLISRIRPFVKVVRLSGRYGQQGFKGQAILFAQEVEEVIEQLPLNVANAGISIVTEKLENVTSDRRYSVDVDKIKKALDWLVINNHLYSNVTINTNITNEELRSSIMEAVVTLNYEGQDQIRDEPKNHYKCLGNDRHILRGSFHQGSERFEELSRGRQCTANAATAIAYSHSKTLNEWASSDLDRVLLAGNKYFNECMSRLVVRPSFLNTEELLPAVSVANTVFNLNIQPDVVVGVVNSSAPSEVLEGYFSNLSSGVDLFFATHDKGIVTCQTNIAVAVMKSDDTYYLFDSHSRGPKGFVAPVKGTSMLMKFPDLSALCEHLEVALQVRRCKDMQYSITALSASTNIISPLVSNEPGETQNQSSGNEDTNNVFDNGCAYVTTALIPIDVNIPNLTDIVTNVDIGERPIPIYELKRKTVPPISLLKEQRAEELAWTKLFPDGRNGLKEQRSVPITPLDYYQTRVMGSDKRFQLNEYLFYALSVVELCKAQQNVSVCARLRQDGAEPTDVIQNVHLVMRNIRGTSAYWHKAYTDLLAMVKNLGPPHWYLTLSCNDLNWPDMLNALLVADGRPNFSVENLTFQEKQRLVENYPVTISRHFMLRLNALLNKLRRENDPILGKKIIDFWWRVEFQLRGSPHVHMVIWCADMPAFDSPEGIQLLDQVVTCKIPNAEDDQEMHDLVVQLQTHRYTQTCYKNDRNSCRFGFPRPVSESTKILDDDQAIRNGGRFYVLKRNESETMINCYNSQLLKLWRANIDLQSCGSALGVAYYISKYISKAEPAEVSRSIRQAIQNVRDRGESNSARLVFAIQNAILSHREISANECAFRLCHLKLRDSSRKCVFVNTCIPELRYRMLRFDTDSSEPYKNVFDRYVHRPHSLEHLSLGEFAVWYDVVSTRAIDFDEDQQDADVYDTHNDEVANVQYITLLDNVGRMKKRSRPAILRTRYFTLASDPEAYYYSLILTHVPFRTEEELLEGFDSAKEAFWAKKLLLRPLHEGFDAESMARVEVEIQQAISRIVAENLAAGVEGQQNFDINFDNDHQPIDCLLDDVEQIIIDEFQEPNDVSMSDIQFETAVASLNFSQRHLFQRISQKLLDPTNQDQLLIFVTGGAGTGKTFTLKVMTEQIRRLSCVGSSKRVAVTAPTGVAARLIGGSTLHSTFALPIEKGRVEGLRPITGERLQRERQKWRLIDWLIIDEISMVPYMTLRNIHLRLQQLKQDQGLFGGINIILFGDLMQLPPVSKTIGGAYCFRQPPSLAGEIDLWQSFNFCELSQNMRQVGDNTFVDILNNIRVGELTMDQLEVLDSRRIPLVGPFADGEAVRIFPTTKLVDAYNSTMTAKLGKSLKLYHVNAVDISLEMKTYGQSPRKDFIPDDPNKTGGILTALCIGVGSRVMLRRNINVNHGLVNGAMGVIRKIEWPALRRDQLEPGELPQAVFIEFDDSKINGNQPGVGVRIEPCTIDFDALRRQGKIERRMLPVILCWAVTVHKLQGTTLDRAVVDLSSHIFAKGQAYVALSRVRTLAGLAISALKPKKLLDHPHDKNSLNELQRLRGLSSTNSY